jgi:multiple antibiotic resistance protein
VPSFDALINIFATLFVTIDPPGLAPIFLALTEGMNRHQRTAVGLRATIVAFFVLVFFSIAGFAVLSLLGITIHAFRVAGGLLLFYIAFEMVFARRSERKERATESVITRDHIANIAVFPLAVPLIAGPGAISATILIATQSREEWTGQLVVIAIIAIVLVITWLFFLAAERVDRLLGATGRTILTRLLGLLLAALAVQFVADGVRALAAA